MSDSPFAQARRGGGVTGGCAVLGHAIRMVLREEPAQATCHEIKERLASPPAEVHYG